MVFTNQSPKHVGEFEMVGLSNSSMTALPLSSSETVGKSLSTSGYNFSSDPAATSSTSSEFYHKFAAIATGNILEWLHYIIPNIILLLDLCYLKSVTFYGTI